MRIVVTGGRGMLGRTLQRELSAHEIVVADLPEWDITDAADFDARLAASRADAVVHCAAMTAVDRCETEKELAYKLNAFGTANVAAACHRNGARLIAISTDYVFAGDSDRPYNEFDVPNGGNTVYGQSKFAGEEAVRRHCPDHVICRISWLYGKGGPSFVHTMLKLADGTRPELKVVDDQRGNPTSTKVVADEIRFLLDHPSIEGVVHGTCEGVCSWYGLTVELFRLLGLKRGVVPCTTAEFPRPAPRPAYSALANTVLALNGYHAPDWKSALADFVREEFGAASAQGVVRATE